MWGKTTLFAIMYSSSLSSVLHITGGKVNKKGRRRMLPQNEDDIKLRGKKPIAATGHCLNGCCLSLMVWSGQRNEN